MRADRNSGPESAKAEPSGPLYRLYQGFSRRNNEKARKLFVSQLPYRCGGGCRIRTRVGLPPNGFQDRPVMTASVTLRMLCGWIIHENGGNCKPRREKTVRPRDASAWDGGGRARSAIFSYNMKHYVKSACKAYALRVKSEWMNIKSPRRRRERSPRDEAARFGPGGRSLRTRKEPFFRAYQTDIR